MTEIVLHRRQTPQMSSQPQNQHSKEAGQTDPAGGHGCQETQGGLRLPSGVTRKELAGREEQTLSPKTEGLDPFPEQTVSEWL